MLRFVFFNPAAGSCGQAGATGTCISSDLKSGKSRIVLTEATPGAWIDFEHVEVRFLQSSGRFLWPSWRDGNMHLYRSEVWEVAHRSDRSHAGRLDRLRAC